MTPVPKHPPLDIVLQLSGGSPQVIQGVYRLLSERQDKKKAEISTKSLSLITVN